MRPLTPAPGRSVKELEVRSSGASGASLNVDPETGDSEKPPVSTEPDDRFEETIHATLERVKAAWRQGRLSIIAGAGVSLESGLPTWGVLLNSLLVNFVEKTYKQQVREDVFREIVGELEQELRHQSPIVYAQFIRSRFTEEEFLENVHSAMYSGNSDAPSPGAICRAIVRLGHKLNSVLTFNYDDLLERALAAEGHESTTVCRAADWATVKGIPVYHPHGVLPFKREEDGHYWIVLTESDYHTQYASPHLWSNIAVSRVLLESTCLFIGTSLTDPNLRRLLDAAHREQPDREHFLIAMWPGDGNSLANATRNALLEVLEASHQQLGVTPLWINEYSEIPSLIDKIRELSLGG